jgi:hypothetical protein
MMEGAATGTRGCATATGREGNGRLVGARRLGGSAPHGDGEKDWQTRLRLGAIHSFFRLHKIQSDWKWYM